MLRRFLRLVVMTTLIATVVARVRARLSRIAQPSPESGMDIDTDAQIPWEVEPRTPWTHKPLVAPQPVEVADIVDRREVDLRESPAELVDSADVDNDELAAERDSISDSSVVDEAERRTTIRREPSTLHIATAAQLAHLHAPTAPAAADVEPLVADEPVVEAMPVDEPVIDTTTVDEPVVEVTLLDEPTIELRVTEPEADPELPEVPVDETPDTTVDGQVTEPEIDIEPDPSSEITIDLSMFTFEPIAFDPAPAPERVVSVKPLPTPEPAPAPERTVEPIDDDEILTALKALDSPFLFDAPAAEPQVQPAAIDLRHHAVIDLRPAIPTVNGSPLWIEAASEVVPSGYPVKVKVATGRVYGPTAANYERVRADRYYISVDAALEDGHGPSAD